jgi:hypothetical protein
MDLIIEPSNYTLIDISEIDVLPEDYPEEFKLFCKENNIKLPKIDSGSGKALVTMIKYRYRYFNRVKCDEFVKKFGIKTPDSIQLFNKANQKGIKSNSDLKDFGKSYVIYPYCLSNKYKMRKNFKFNGSEEEKNIEIDKIKSTIKSDYVDVENNLWQLGHKNPGSTDSSGENLVLQPPIQGKYRDDYIFIDTLTKIPLAHRLSKMIQNKEIEFTQDQIISYKTIFDELLTSI